MLTEGQIVTYIDYILRNGTISWDLDSNLWETTGNGSTKRDIHRSFDGIDIYCHYYRLPTVWSYKLGITINNVDVFYSRSWVSSVLTNDDKEFISNIIDNEYKKTKIIAEERKQKEREAISQQQIDADIRKAIRRTKLRESLDIMQGKYEPPKECLLDRIMKGILRYI